MENPRIVFFGSGYYVIPIVERLYEYGLALVVTTESKNGKLSKFCKANNIECKSVSSFSENLKSYILNLKPKVAVLASFGAIIPKDVIELFPQGILNIHPSLLPKYKGPSPVQYTILNGDKITGTTVIKLDEEIDHGPIIAQEKLGLDGSETYQGLTEKLFKVGAEMIIKIIQKIEHGSKIKETAQDHSKEIFTERLTRDSGKIDLNKPLLPNELNRKIRAYYPWPGVWFRANLNGRLKTVKLFPEEKVQVEGKNIMSYKDFINGYGKEAKEILKALSLT